MAETLPARTGVDHDAILRFLRLNPEDVATQALLLICSKYGLDPLMKHVVLISSRPYVTRDGYLHLAHESGQLDGIEVVEEGQSDSHWTAKVAVYRKDMTRPFSYTGRYPFTGTQKQYGPEMAVKTAEVMALRRAFDVTGIGAAEERWDDTANDAEVVPPAPVIPLATTEQIDTIRALTKRLAEGDYSQVVAGKTLRTATVFEQRLLDDEGQIAITAKAAEGLIGTLEGLVEDAEAPFTDEPESRPVVDAVSQTGFL